jgi:hypothetical protein
MRPALFFAALAALCLSAAAQRPGEPGQGSGNTEVAVRYDQDDVDPGERARIEVINSEDNIDYVIRTYPLRAANAADLFDVINQAVDQEEGRVDTLALGGRVEVDPMTGEVSIEDATESFFVITAPEWMFPGLDQTIETIDRVGLSSWNDGTLDHYFTLQHRRPSEVVGLLGEYVTDRAILIPDDNTNTLYVHDSPNTLRAIVRAIGAFDIPSQVVMIEVEIVEITRDDDENLGIWWDAWKLTLPTEMDTDLFWFNDRGRDADIDAEVTDFGFSDVVSGTTDRFTRTNQFSASLAFNNLSPQAAAEFINYLVNEGHARILTTTRLSALQSETARLDSATEFQSLVLTQQESEGSRVLTDVFSVDGIELEITPFIGTNTIRLDIEAEVGSLAGFGETGLPITSRRKFEGQAVLRDGQSFTLAGLSRDQIVSESSGIPGLRRILPFLFSREIEVRRTSDIVMFLTPRLVQPGGAYRGQEQDQEILSGAKEDLAELRD